MRIHKTPFMLALLACLWFPVLSAAQYANPLGLDGTPFTMDFDFLGNGTSPASSDPHWTAFSMRIGANSSGIGNTVDYSSFNFAPASWSQNVGGLYNVASQGTLATSASIAEQNASLDRALGVLPSTSGLGKTNFAYTFEFTNASKYTSYRFQFDSYVVRNNFGSTTTYQVRYGLGGISSDATIASVGSSFSTGDSAGKLLSFDMILPELTSKTEPNYLWIQILATADTGTSSTTRDFFAIDNVKLTYVDAAPVPEAGYFLLVCAVALVCLRFTPASHWFEPGRQAKSTLPSQ